MYNQVFLGPEHSLYFNSVDTHACNLFFFPGNVFYDYFHWSYFVTKPDVSSFEKSRQMYEGSSFAGMAN